MTIVRGNCFFPRTTFLPISSNGENHRMRLICPCKEHAPSRVLYYSILSP